MRQKRTASGELTELRARVLQWRKQDGGGRGSRIPEELWQEAIRVARVDGLYATARATRFNYERLKERSGQAGQDKVPATVVAGETRRAQVVLGSGNKGLWVKGTGRVRSVDPEATGGAGGAEGGSRFVALQVAAPRIGSQTTIELLGRRGDRMRVEVTGEVDVVGLAQMFWSRPS
jgi:hypothetical protein